jgi:hypothetical protein
MLGKIVDLLKAYFGESTFIRWTLVLVVILALISLYGFFVKESGSSFNKYYEYKLEKCARAALTAAQIGNSDDEETLREALRHFDELYYGELVLFEKSGLEKEMVAFRRMLGQDSEDLDQNLDYRRFRAKRDEFPSRFKQAALRLSAACRYEVTPSWISAIIDRLTFPWRKYQ